ncbi:LysR family transcriptional regulator [Sphingomonas sp. LaA6.9]|uniref:LysR family transcriptional regulator n=1 Tax=Sphingomonas sp. LaA6.9 TaxID=2919914 RepID=UPI001F4FDF35|nr:LysR family transcriptional regulator [Sphingomonas sp. LaA6.9]MCJ8159002.1 LysR family transcriptional regulator [Sphingomonas sp. LaA6.9]
MDLIALEDFNLVAWHGGFGRASRAANRPKATLSRKVRELEEDLGVRLFERSARTLKLTTEGRFLHERTSGLLAEIEHVADSLGTGADQPRGTLRVSVPLLFSQIAMGKIAAGFIANFPQVTLEVTAEDRAVDLVDEGYDVVIRVNPSPTEELVGRCFLHDEMLVVAAPGFARPSAKRRDKAPLPVQAVVLTATSGQAFWRINSDRGGEVLAPQSTLRLSSLVMVRDAVRAGAGAGMLPKSMVMSDIAAGRLTNWGQVSGTNTEIWALYTSRRLLSSKVSAFVQCLLKTFPNGSSQELAAMLAG